MKMFALRSRFVLMSCIAEIDVAVTGVSLLSPFLITRDYPENYTIAVTLLNNDNKSVVELHDDLLLNFFVSCYLTRTLIMTLADLKSNGSLSVSPVVPIGSQQGLEGSATSTVFSYLNISAVFDLDFYGCEDSAHLCVALEDSPTGSFTDIYTLNDVYCLSLAGKKDCYPGQMFRLPLITLNS